MATFLAEFSLCGLVPGPGGDTGGVLGVEQGGNDTDLLLLTDRGRTVTLYKVSDQKPLGSWTVKQGQTITCPAVFNFATGEYVTVHDNKVLRIWKEDDVNLEKVFKATLSADVCRIHSLPKTEPLVLFNGGATRFLDALLAAPQQEIPDIISPGEVIRWSQVLVDGKQTVLIFIAERDGDWFVYVQNLNLNSLLKYNIHQESEACVPLTFAATLQHKFITVISLFSSGHVYEIGVPFHRPETEGQHFLPKSPLIKLPLPSNTALVILDKTHVAILGSLHSEQSASKEGLFIWNTKFQTLQASKELPQGTSGQLWCYGGKLYVPHGKVLTVTPYQCGPSSLAASLGKLKDIQQSESEEVPSVLNWNTFLGGESEPPLTVKNETKKNRSAKKNVDKVERQDVSIGKLLFNVKNAYPSHVEEELTCFLSSHTTPDYHVMTGKVATALVARCKAQPHFYPRGVLIQLVQSNQLSYSSCPDLIALLLEKEDMHLVQLCLQQFPDVPEAVTCSCLKAVLCIGDAALEKVAVDLESVICYIDVDSEQTDKPADIVQNGFSPALLEEDSCDGQLIQKLCPPEPILTCPVGMKRAALLNAVLITKYSETFLLPHLKDLSAQQVMLLLQYLHYLYLKCSEIVGTTLPGVNAPNMNQIIDWMSLLLDAHFTVVVMLPEAKGLLANLHKFVRSQVKLYSELNKIEGSLLELQKMKRQKEDRGLYSIEILEFV
ncbi:nucleolar protein 11 [Ambystoma mexicanum]|uniref:nucleolar protein 11 n=1 Tax=Ambystoma mexicanum TaxID=8296 RepID=UPI0037E8B2CD